MADFLSTAWDFYNKAWSEFDEGMSKQDATLLRDACEKGWGAIIEAVNGLCEKLKIAPMPESNRERRKALKESEAKDSKLRNFGIEERFNARCFKLHAGGFYRGTLPPDEIKRELERVREFIKMVEEV